VAITRKVIINDDLQALTRVPAALGQAAANWRATPCGPSSPATRTWRTATPLFHANHKNLNGSNALAGPALGRGPCRAFRVQKAPQGHCSEPSAPVP